MNFDLFRPAAHEMSSGIFANVRKKIWILENTYLCMKRKTNSSSELIHSMSFVSYTYIDRLEFLSNVEKKMYGGQPTQRAEVENVPFFTTACAHCFTL